MGSDMWLHVTGVFYHIGEYEDSIYEAPYSLRQASVNHFKLVLHMSKRIQVEKKTGI
jgi:hypothetical protein